MWTPTSNPTAVTPAMEVLTLEPQELGPLLTVGSEEPAELAAWAEMPVPLRSKVVKTIFSLVSLPVAHL